jgi:hypothetical protein
MRPTKRPRELTASDGKNDTLRLVLRQFLSITVAVELTIAAVWTVTLWAASKYYSKALAGKSVKLKSDYLKTPTSNALTVLGLLVPILVALTSYLYSTKPDVDYGSLLTTIILYFGVLIVAIWETFAILKKASQDDTIELTYPQDRRFVTGLGLMYGMLILGLCYFAFFFLFEIKPSQPSPIQTQASAAPAPFLVYRPVLNVDDSRALVLQTWGSPARWKGNDAEYDSLQATVRLTFDDLGKLRQITVTRR